METTGPILATLGAILLLGLVGDLLAPRLPSNVRRGAFACAALTAPPLRDRL